MAKRKSSEPAAVVNAAEAMGQAVGKAMAALESTVSRRRRSSRPNGYARLAQKRHAAQTADRSRARRPAPKTAGTRRRPAVRKKR